MIHFPSVKTSKKTSNFSYLLKKQRGLALLPVIFFALAYLGEIHAQGLPFPQAANWGPTTLGMGGASAAATMNHDAFLTNPAGLVFYLGKGGLAGHYEELPKDRSSWSVSMIDGTSGVIGGFQFNTTDISSFTRQTYSLDVAYKTPYGSLGGGANAMRFTGVGAGRGWHFTNTAGVIIPFLMGFAVGAYGEDIYDLQNNHQFPPSAHFGILYTLEGATRITFDADRRFVLAHQDWNYSVGGDMLLSQYFLIRAGYHWDHAGAESFWSAGTGVIAPKIEITGVFIRTIYFHVQNGLGFDVNFKF